VLNLSPNEKSNLIEQLKLIEDEKIRIQIDDLISEFELCEIRNYRDLGISYLFKCKNDSQDNFIDTDEEYFLLKILNPKREEEFIYYEQFVDYRTELTKLSNDWYFIKIDIFYD